MNNIKNEIPNVKSKYYVRIETVAHNVAKNLKNVRDENIIKYLKYLGWNDFLANFILSLSKKMKDDK